MSRYNCYLSPLAIHFSPAHHQLLASMVYVVGENSSTLVIPGLAFMVFGLMLG